MDKRNDESLRRRARERAVYRYFSALERGDFDTVTAILAQAEDDTGLAQMIDEVNDALATEYEEAAREREALPVREMLTEHLPSGFAPDDHYDHDFELPPLTIATVAAHMREDAAQRGQMTAELKTLTEYLADNLRPLSDELSLGTVRKLFSELGISASPTLIKQFRTTAIYLAEGREQGQAYQAAARRQRESRRIPRTEQTGEEEQS